MPNFFPCPNPACTYQFDAEQLPAAAMVTCPICRTRFPYRAAAPSASAEAPATERDDNPFSSGKPVERVSKPNRLVTVRNVPKSKRANAAWMAIGASLVVAAILFAIITSLKNPKSPLGNPKSEEFHTYEAGNLKFRNFDDVWKDDVSLKGKMNVGGFVRRRSDPDAWIVVHWSDYQKRNPRGDEMRQVMYNMLKQSMTNVQVVPLEKVTVGDEQAEGVQFEARYGESDIYGEGLSFRHQGIGYVLFIFSTSAKWADAEKELKEYRKSFAFADQRNNWREVETESKPLFEKDKPYQLSDGDRVWQKARLIDEKEATTGREFAMTFESLKAHDEKAAMFLKMKAPTKNVEAKRDAPEAEAMVLELDKAAGNPLEAARNYVQAALEKDVGPNFKIAFNRVDKTTSGVVIPGNVIAFRKEVDKDRMSKKYYAVSVLSLDDKLIVAVAWCWDKDSDIFEPYLLNLVGSLKRRE